jgi:hypothetical protein
MVLAAAACCKCLLTLHLRLRHCVLQLLLWHRSICSSSSSCAIRLAAWTLVLLQQQGLAG